MPKNERFDFDRPPVPTPKHLENSKRAIADLLIATGAANEQTVGKNPRIRRIDEKIPGSQIRYREWQAKVKRAKAVYRRRAT